MCINALDFDDENYHTAEDNWSGATDSFYENAAVVWFENQYAWTVDTFWSNIATVLVVLHVLLAYLLFSRWRKRRAFDHAWTLRNTRRVYRR